MNSVKKNNGSSNLLLRVKGLLNTRRKIAIFLLIVLALGYGGWRFFKGGKQQPQYQTTKVQKGTIVSSVTASGQILTTNIVNITTSTSGIVQEVFVKDGDYLNKGDKIAQITPDTAGQQQVAQANSSYLTAKTNLDAANSTLYSLQSDMFTKWKKFIDLSTSSTYQNSDGSPRNDQRTSAEFNVAQNDWLAAQAKDQNQQGVITQAQADLSSKAIAHQLSSPVITAPIAGTVSNLAIVPGMTLGTQGSSVSVGTGGSGQSNQNSQRVAVIQNEGMPIATFNVSEVDIGKVKIDEKATMILDALNGKTFTGRVVTADHIGTVTSGVTNYTVLIAFDTGNEQVLPNMAASASIIIDSKDDVLIVPSSAVQTQGGQATVRVLKGSQPQQVDVETGLTSDSQTEIVLGLSEGDEVITSAASITTNSTQQPGGSLFGRPGGFGGLRPGGGGGGGGRGD